MQIQRDNFGCAQTDGRFDGQIAKCAAIQNILTISFDGRKPGRDRNGSQHAFHHRMLRIATVDDWLACMQVRCNRCQADVLELAETQVRQNTFRN
jgi:hypothetical protein